MENVIKVYLILALIALLCVDFKLAFIVVCGCLTTAMLLSDWFVNIFQKDE